MTPPISFHILLYKKVNCEYKLFTEIHTSINSYYPCVCLNVPFYICMYVGLFSSMRTNIVCNAKG